MLDPIHHQGLRLALGSFRTSPSESLLAEANEPSLYNRHLKLSMQFALKLKSNPSNPTYETVFEPQYKTLLENKPNMISSFGIGISSEFENMNLDLDNIADFKISDVPPWTVFQPRVLYPVWQHTFVSPSAFSRRAVVSYWRKCVHEVLVNRLGGLSLPRKSVVRLTDRPDMTLDVYRGRKTTMQQQQQFSLHNDKKSKTDPLVFRTKLHEL